MREIPLNQGKVALVDDEDYEKISQYKWTAHKNANTFYAESYPTVSVGKRIYINMHSKIINIPEGLQCDHIDGNGLNNQKSNLRVVNHRQNQQNQHTNKSSKYPGIYRQKRDGFFRAKIKINNHVYHIGAFRSEEEAARQYKTACMIVDIFQSNTTPDADARQRIEDVVKELERRLAQSKRLRTYFTSEECARTDGYESGLESAIALLKDGVGRK